MGGEVDRKDLSDAKYHIEKKLNTVSKRASLESLVVFLGNDDKKESQSKYSDLVRRSSTAKALLTKKRKRNPTLIRRWWLIFDKFMAALKESGRLDEVRHPREYMKDLISNIGTKVYMWKREFTGDAELSDSTDGEWNSQAEEEDEDLTHYANPDSEEDEDIPIDPTVEGQQAVPNGDFTTTVKRPKKKEEKQGTIAMKALDSDVNTVRRTVRGLVETTGKHGEAINRASKVTGALLTMLENKPVFEDEEAQTESLRVLRLGRELTSVTAQAELNEKKKKKKKEKPKKVKEFNLTGMWGKVFTTMPKGAKKKGTPLPNLVAVIHEMYDQKIKADEIDDSFGKRRQDLQEFGYDFHLNFYGLRTLATGHMYKAAGGTKKNYKDVLDFYLHTKATCAKLVSKKMPPHQKYWNLEKTGLTVAEDIVERAIDIVFRSKTEARRTNIKKMVRGTKTAGDRPYNFDTAMAVLIDFYESGKDVDQEKFVTLFQEADKDGDGNLTLEEFTSICTKVDPDICKSDVLHIYSEAIESSDDCKMTPEVFAAAATKYNAGSILANKHLSDDETELHT